MDRVAVAGAIDRSWWPGPVTGITPEAKGSLQRGLGVTAPLNCGLQRDSSVSQRIPSRKRASAAENRGVTPTGRGLPLHEILERLPGTVPELAVVVASGCAKRQQLPTLGCGWARRGWEGRAGRTGAGRAGRAGPGEPGPGEPGPEGPGPGGPGGQAQSEETAVVERTALPTGSRSSRPLHRRRAQSRTSGRRA